MEAAVNEVTAMCNLSKGIWEKGVEEGFKKSYEKGKTAAALLYIGNVMESTGWSMEQTMAAMNIPEVDRAKYAGLLEDSPCTN